MGMRSSYLGRNNDVSSQNENASASARKMELDFEDHEGKKLRDAKTVFSFWSAMKYVLILSLFLWWLPLFGQMIAGYVGGRKAGGPWRGVLAAIIPIIAIFVIITAFETGIFPQEIFGVNIAPSALFASISAAIPFLGPYLDFTREYVSQFVATLEGSSPYEMNSYLLTLVFAYVGGIIAAQKRREIEYTSGNTVSHTTVFMAPYQNSWEGVEGALVIPQKNTAFMPQHIAHYNRAWGVMPWLHKHGRPKKIRTERFDQLIAENSENDQAVGHNEIIEIAPKRMWKREIEEATIATGRANRKKKAARRKRKRPITSRTSMAGNGARKKQLRSRDRNRILRAKTRFAPAERKRKYSSRQLVINPKEPRTIRKAQKIIEREWNPEKRKKRAVEKKLRKPLQLANISPRKDHKKEVAKRKRTSRKGFVRSWETM